MPSSARPRKDVLTGPPPYGRWSTSPSERAKLLDQIADTGARVGQVDRWSDSAAYRAILGRAVIGSILVMKVDHIGDFILGFDALAALRQAFPRASIELLCAPWNEALARSLDLFDDVHTIVFFNRRADGETPPDRAERVKELPTKHYDLAIDLRVDPDTRLLLRHVSATYKLGFESPSEDDILTVALPHRLPARAIENIGMHQTMLMLRLVRTAADLFNRTDDVKRLLLGRVAEPFDIDLTAAQDRTLVVVNTSSGRAVKNWPAERFRRLVRWLAVDMDAVVLLVGGPDQLAETGDIIGFCGSRNVISTVGQTTMGQAVHLVSQASLFVGNDSALTHVAARIGIPTVVLFSGIDPPVMWAALGSNVTILRVPVACSPCHILQFDECVADHACMRDLSEASVRAAVRRQLLAAARYGRPDAGRPNSGSPDSGHKARGLHQDASFRGWAGARSEQVPQRYDQNIDRYEAVGGELRIGQLLQGFTHNSPGNRGDLNRFYTLALVFDQIIKEKTYGDVAELGVYKGNTAFMLAGLARQTGATAYLLDTFEGFSEEDLSGVDNNKSMEFADTSLEQVRALVGEANVRFVKGFFPDTADQIPDDARFSLVHIDCDLYAPFRAALHFFYERLVPGGFLVMHDYSSLHWDGAERAVDEFFADKPESVVPVPDGAGTVIVRKSTPVDRFSNWFVQGRIPGFANAWIHANSQEVKAHLTSGWSQPEEWGTWGLGASHVIGLLPTQRPMSGIELAAETMVVLSPGRRDHASVGVLVGGELLDVWEYDQAHNRGVRTVTIPREKITLRQGVPFLDLEFRPDAWDSPNDLDPSIPDVRPLGLGLVRFRQRQL